MNHARILWTYVEYCWCRARTADRGDREAGQTVEHVLWYVLGAAAVVGIAGLVYAAIRTEAQKGIPTTP